jgi:fatty-acyl-CoA synthase
MANAFLDPVLARAKLHPDEVFAEVWAGDSRCVISYRELVSSARRFAGAFRAAGAPGDVVFIILQHGTDLYGSFLGAMLAGMVPSFLPFPSAKQDPDLYWRSHQAVFARTRPAAILTYPPLADEVARACAGLPIRVLTAAALDEPVALDALPDDCEIALLQHSSGTTGLKKGVALSYRAIEAQIQSYARAVRLHPQSSRIASWLPLYHDMGLISCFLTPLRLGIPIASLDAFEWTARPYLLLEAIEASSATHAWLPNFAFNHVARVTPRSRRYDLSSLHALIDCSEPCKSGTFDVFYERFRDEGVRQDTLQVCYAMAETVFAATQTEPGRTVRRLTIDREELTSRKRATPSEDPTAISLLSNGAPIDGVELCIVQDGARLADGTVGEVCVRAEFLFSGYFKDPAATGEALVDGWYRTGDLGFVHDGELFVTGRLKDVIIVNGRNYYAHDIEEIASIVPGIKPGRTVAFGVFAAAMGSEQIVVVAERDPAAAATGALAPALNAALSRALGLAAGDIRIVDPGWLVKTTSGKISRAGNARKYATELRPAAEPVISLQLTGNSADDAAI